MNPRLPSPAAGRRAPRLFLCLVLAAPLFAAEPVRRRFDLPADTAERALKRLAEQSGVEVLIPNNLTRDLRTVAVSGEFTAREALERMLAGSGLEAAQDAKSGALTVRVPSDPNAGRAAAAPARSRPAPDRAAGPGGTVPDEAVRLDAFTVDASRDTGYLARRSVSVSRINTPVIDLAQSVEIFTEDFMLDVGATGYEDVLYYSASLASTEHNLEGMSPQAIRGLGSGFVLRNGFRVARSGGDAVNLDRTEIVKGASAVLYGQTAIGGVINYVTKVPRARPRTSLSASYGSWESARATLDTTGPLGSSQRVLYRLVGSWQESGTWIQWGYNDVRFVSPKVSFLPTRELRIDLSYEHYDRRFLFASTVPFNSSASNRPFNPPAPVDWESQGPKFFNEIMQKSWEAMATYTPAPHTTLRLAGFFSELDVDRLFRGGQNGTVETGTGRARTGTNPATTAAGLAANQGRISRNIRVDDQLYLRLEGVTTADTRLGTTKLFYGGEFTRTSDTVRGQQQNPFFGTATPYYNNGQLGLPAPPVYFDNFKTFLTSDPAYNAALDALLASPIYRDVTGFGSELWAYYGTAVHTLPNGKLSVNAGLRFDEENLDDFVPQYGILFKPVARLSLYGLYSQSWLAQSTNSLPLPDGTTTGYRGPVTPATGETVEFGLKADFGKAYLTLAVFDMENSGKLRSGGNPNWDPNLPPTHIDSNRNVARLTGLDTSRGWEVSGVTQLAPNWQATLSFMHLQAVTPPVEEGDQEEVLLGSPRNAFTFWTRYNVERGPLQGVGLGGGVKYAAARRLGGQGDYTDPARWIYEGSLFYRTRVFGRDTRLQLNVKNLEDEIYFWDRARYAPPLNWRFSVSTTF